MGLPFSVLPPPQAGEGVWSFTEHSPHHPCCLYGPHWRLPPALWPVHCSVGWFTALHGAGPTSGCHIPVRKKSPTLGSQSSVWGPCGHPCAPSGLKRPGRGVGGCAPPLPYSSMATAIQTAPQRLAEGLETRCSGLPWLMDSGTVVNARSLTLLAPGPGRTVLEVCLGCLLGGK